MRTETREIIVYIADTGEEFNTCHDALRSELFNILWNDYYDGCIECASDLLDKIEIHRDKIYEYITAIKEDERKKDGTKTEKR